MSAYIRPTPALLAEIEPAAGEFVRRSTRRDAERDFYPAWSYIASPKASLSAVVAALTLGCDGVPEQWWEPVLRVHCPRATAYLAEQGVHARDLICGRVPIGLTEEAARLVNTELGGYQVLVVPDTAAMMAEVIGTLGAVPEFVDEDGAR